LKKSLTNKKLCDINVAIKDIPLEMALILGEKGG
jgi:hypothetical protein